MGAISAHYAKATLPVCNRPLIALHLASLASLGIRHVVVVVGHRAESVIRTATAHKPDGVHVDFVEQEQRLGIADALFRAEPQVRGQNLVVILGDTHFIADNLAAGLGPLSAGARAPAAVLSVRRVRDPEMIRRECTVRLDDHGNLVEIREKPRTPFNDLKPCGIYFFSPAIFDAIDMTPASPLRGEVEITDAIQTLVSTGQTVGSAHTVAWDRNINYPGDILLSNLVELDRRHLVRLMGRNVALHREAVVDHSVVGNDVSVSSPARIIRSLVLDGAVVDQHGDFVDCVVGPGFAVPDCLDAEWADTPDGFSLAQPRP
jgi:dTDP-glucose pyrophosphorylase